MTFFVVVYDAKTPFVYKDSFGAKYQKWAIVRFVMQLEQAIASY